MGIDDLNHQQQMSGLANKQPISHLTKDEQIAVIFDRVAAYNQTHDTSKRLFFDTETIGGGREDQIIEIAFCDSDRHVIIDTLIYTDRTSSPGAFKVHGIYPHELIGKPTFIDIQPAIVQLLKGRTLYAYNASFDVRMMRQSGHKLRLQQVEVKCLCKQFADFIGQYSLYFKANRYFSLSKAMAHFGVEYSNAHRARPDALACATVWQGMMGSHHWDY